MTPWRPWCTPAATWNSFRAELARPVQVPGLGLTAEKAGISRPPPTASQHEHKSLSLAAAPISNTCKVASRTQVREHAPPLCFTKRGEVRSPVTTAAEKKLPFHEVGRPLMQSGHRWAPASAFTRFGHRKSSPARFERRGGTAKCFHGIFLPVPRRPLPLLCCVKENRLFPRLNRDSLLPNGSPAVVATLLAFLRPAASEEVTAIGSAPALPVSKASPTWGPQS